MSTLITIGGVNQRPAPSIPVATTTFRANTVSSVQLN